MRAYWDGSKMWTRSGLPIASPDWFTEHFPADLELDGELFLDRKMFDETMSITRRNDGSGDWHKITYVVFDAPTVQGGIMTRLDAAKTILASCASTNIRVHPHEMCRGEEHLMLELARVEGLGGEGLMLRKLQAAHRAGRNSDLLKVKTFHDDEALITDYEAGKGKYNGMVGSLVCILRGGGRFKVGSGLTDSQRSYTSAPKIGTVITFKYFELSADGIPRFPTYLRVRPDVSASEFPTP
jgi:DNA ligase 1